MKRLILFLVLFQASNLFAQDVSGLWVGRFTSSNLFDAAVPYRYELLIFQDGKQLKGYSYSTEGNGNFYSICNIKGVVYDGYMVVNEISTLYQVPEEPSGFLQQHILFFGFEDKEVTGEWKQTEEPNIKELMRRGKTFLKKEADPKQSQLISILEKKKTIVVDQPVAPAPFVNKDSLKLASRPKQILQTILIDADSVSIELYDDGLIDGDSVSVFLNDRVLLNKFGLTDKVFKKTIVLPNNNQPLVLSMFAESEGSIPPNTGLLIIRSGEAKHEIRFSSDTKKTAAIELRRK